MKKLLTLLSFVIITTVALAADKYVSSSGDLILKTAVSKKVNLNDALYTTQSGNVGIGQSNPSSYKLQIKSDQASFNGLSVYNDSSDGAAKAGIAFGDHNGSDQNRMYTNAAGKLFIDNLYTNGMEIRANTLSTPVTAIAIDSAGKACLGGCTAPVSVLHVRRDNGTFTNPGKGSDSILAVDNSAGTTGQLSQISMGLMNVYAPAAIAAIMNSSAAYSSSHLAFYTRDATTDTAPTERMRIESGGPIAIGNVLKMGAITGGNGVGLRHKSASGPYSCNTQCSNTGNVPAAFNNASGACLQGWRSASGAVRGCSDATSESHRCLCTAMY